MRTSRVSLRAIALEFGMHHRSAKPTLLLRENGGLARSALPRISSLINETLPGEVPSARDGDRSGLPS
jgi:hypothetical protein